MCTFKMDLALSEFMKRKPSYPSPGEDMNEAQTRLTLIDDILFHVLDWTTSDVEVEKYCRPGFADYVFHCDQRASLTLEAKRSEIPFTLKGAKYEDRPYTFAFLKNESKEAALALQQAIGYAAILGTRYVAISNGHQWLFTLTFLPDQHIDERLVYVFESLDTVKSRFRSFCNCFTKYHVEFNTTMPDLIESLQKSPPPKLSSSIPGYPQPARRNVFRNELAYILDYVWQLMADDEETEEFVRNCYVNPSTHAEAIELVREILTRRASEDEMIGVEAIDGADSIPHKMAQLPTQKPFVVLGEIGRGKSSFLKYLRYVAATDLLKNYIQIDINFLDRPDSAVDVHTFVYREIEKQLLEVYKIDINDDSFIRGALNLEIGRLKTTPEGKSLYSSPEEYERYVVREIKSMTSNNHDYYAKVFRHLKGGRKHSLAIFFDNLDRRPIDIQEEAFLKSSAIARDWACLVFVCLRPDTFHKSKESGVLDTIAPQTFTVSHPNLPLVLKKRFEYAQRIADGERMPNRISAGGLSRKIAFELPQVSKILKSCEFSARKGHGIVPLLEAVSNGNIRRMLGLAKSILCSGHLDTKKILQKIEESGSYSIPDFEGIKALLYGEYMQYEPKSSPFINLYDLAHANATEHFIRICALRYLAGFPQDGLEAGYVQRSHLSSFLNGCGFSFNAVEDSISLLLRKELIRVKVRVEQATSSEQRLRITSLGRFHLLNLAGQFQYLDAVLVDTPIINSDIREAIKDEYEIHQRIARTKKFLSYLSDAAKLSSVETVTELWNGISKTALENIQDIEARI